MGITQLNPIFSILFPDAIKCIEEKAATTLTSSYDHILFDLNGLFYKLRAHDQTDEALILLALQYLDNLLNQFKPTNSVVIALDGPSPLGKLITSMNRRTNAPMTTLRFTPGTEFMSKAKDALCLFAARYTSSNPNIKVIISGADREGEGEYKLFEYLRNLPLHEGDAFDATKRSRALVMGNDTDLLLFSLRLSQHFEIDFLRLEEYHRTLISIDNMRRSLLSDLVGDHELLLLEFIFITLLSGTDYTPRIGGYDFRKVYFYWRSVRMEANNGNNYILTPKTVQIRPLDPLASESDSIPLGLSKFTNEMVLNVQVLDQFLKGSNIASLAHIHLKIQHGPKLRHIQISRSDWKGNWNALKQAFCSPLKIDFSTVPSPISDHGFVTTIHWIDPSTGVRHLAGEGAGINARTSEYFAGFTACLPSSPIMQQYISKQISAEDFQALSDAILSNISSLEASYWEGRPFTSPLTSPTVSDVHLPPQSTTHASWKPSMDATDTKPISLKKEGGSIGPTENSISTSKQETYMDSNSAASHIFSAYISPNSKINPLTKESKVLEEHDIACEELIKGLVWTILSFSAEIPNGSLFYPYTRTPTVHALQIYLSRVHQHSPTITVSIKPDEIAQSSNPNQLTIPARHYTYDALPPVQWFLAVTARQSGSLVLSHPSRFILKKTPLFDSPVDIQYIEESSKYVKLSYAPKKAPVRQVIERISLKNISQVFSSKLLSSGIQPTQIWQNILERVYFKSSHPEIFNKPMPTSLEELESGLFKTDNSLVFFNRDPPLLEASLSALDHQASQLRHNILMEHWKSDQLDLAEVVKRTHISIKEWTGVYFPKIGCLEEDKVHYEPTNQSLMKAENQDAKFLAYAKQHFRPFNRAKASFSVRYYSTSTMISVHGTWRKKTSKYSVSQSSIAKSSLANHRQVKATMALFTRFK